MPLLHTVYNQYQSFGFDEQYQFISDEQTTSLTWSTDDDPVWENLARGFSLADFNGDGLSDVVLGIRTGNTGISPVIVLFGY